MRDVIAHIAREFKRECGPTIVTVSLSSPLVRRHRSRFLGLCPHPWAFGWYRGEQWKLLALKAMHFIELCSQRQIPLLLLVSITGKCDAVTRVTPSDLGSRLHCWVQG